MFCRTPVWWLRGVCIGKFLPFQSDSPWPLRPKSTTSLVWTGAEASTALITTMHFISLSDSPIEWKLHEGKDSAVFSGSRNVAGYIYKSTHVLLLLFSTVSQSLLRFTSIESVKLSNHLILCRSLLLLPSIFPRIRVGKPELALSIRWPMYWSFSFSPFNEYSGLISFRSDWLDLVGVQRTLKNLLQHHNS